MALTLELETLFLEVLITYVLTASDVELLIVQLLKKLLGIGNTIPPRVLLSISHGVWGKHELRWVHQILWVIPTHQLAPHPLRQI